MSNVTFNAVTSALNAAGNFDASTLWGTAGNFNLLSAAVNSHALNSRNYGQGNSRFESYHVAPGQVVSQHISAAQVNSAKISATPVIQQRMLEFQSSANGMRVKQMGSLSPANGVAGARLSKATAFEGNSGTWIMYYSSNAIDGNPGYTATPVLRGMPVIQGGTGFPALGQFIMSMDSGLVQGWLSADGPGFTTTISVYAEVYGAK